MKNLDLPQACQIRHSQAYHKVPIVVETCPHKVLSIIQTKDTMVLLQGSLKIMIETQVPLLTAREQQGVTRGFKSTNHRLLV